MKRALIIFLIILITGAGQAWGATPVRIGVVDLQKAVSECKAGVSARAKLLKRTEELNNELKAMLADLEKEKADLDKQASRLSEDSRSEKEKKLQKAGRDLQNRQREAQEEVKQLEADSLKKLVGRLSDLMARIGAEGGYTAILDKKNGVFYSGKEADITPLLIKRADSEYE
ncbi:MAG TPA: OmpH family outer membrane protein [Geobacteraceae bacterium]|nr:OmpH family outer membrane protein [Geobacteraceae bacterium]